MKKIFAVLVLMMSSVTWAAQRQPFIHAVRAAWQGVKGGHVPLFWVPGVSVGLGSHWYHEHERAQARVASIPAAIEMRGAKPLVGVQATQYRAGAPRFYTV